MKNNRRGFTLVEMMIALSLLLILLALAYSVFAHLWGTYERTEQKWLIERDVQQTMSRVQAAVSLSYEAQLTNDSAAVLTDKDRRVIYVEGDNLMLRDIGETAALPAIQLNELPIRVSFTNVAAGAAKPSANMVYVTISTVDSSPIAYSLSSAIHLPNIAQSVTVAPAAATPPYSAVAFRTAREGALDLSLGDMNGVGCFIATAAYGSYDQQDVQLLRRFR
ncbi:MAG: prepilin-type N-terminal cleavage/methylation domain-containing protein, partial [Oscillospiraceae bacterium]